jgi:hypothetical protein
MTKPRMAAARIPTTANPRAVRPTMSRSGVSAKIRAKATSSAPYSWLTVQTMPMTPMIEAATAPWLSASRDDSIRSSRGGKAATSASLTVSRTAGSLANQPASPSTRSIVGIAAKSAENARPLASRPPAACP